MVEKFVAVHGRKKSYLTQVSHLTRHKYGVSIEGKIIFNTSIPFDSS
jgi:hypothetical protein